MNEILPRACFVICLTMSALGAAATALESRREGNQLWEAVLEGAIVAVLWPWVLARRWLRDLGGLR